MIERTNDDAGLIFRYSGLSHHAREQIEHAMSRYPYAALARHEPPRKVMDRFIVHAYTAEDCMGRSYTRRSQMWSLHRTPAGLLFLFFDPRDVDTLVRGMPKGTVDPNPFLTVIQDRRPISVREQERQMTQRLPLLGRMRAVFQPLTLKGC